MKKILLYLVVLLSLCSCVDSEIDIFIDNYNGLVNVHGFGDFMELRKDASFVVQEKIKEHKNLDANIIVYNPYRNNLGSRTITTYYYILRVNQYKADKRYYDVFVPEDFYNSYQVGDTIWQVK